MDPNEQLDEEVEELLLQIADDFIESTVNASCQLAKHRQAQSLDVTDVQMHLGVYLYFVLLGSILEKKPFTYLFTLKPRTSMEYVDSWIWYRRTAAV